ncbi:MAG: VCBS repeat-containing protein [Candidatus Marinimicrobia bacterium]|nr:VCBS repeat-containing protein [Candidatus Neomarinimicrobiota bacterium]
MKHLYDFLLVLVVISMSPLYAQTSQLQFSSTAVPAGDGPRSAIFIDMDLDGNADLAVVNLFGSNISLIYGDGTGSFTLQDSVAVMHKSPHNINYADFNGDNVFDVITVNRDSNTIGVFFGDGTGGLLSPTFYSTGSSPRWIAIADFNEDTLFDLAVTNHGDDNFTIFLGDSNGNFVNAENFYTGDGPVPISAGDFNGDGHIDLVVAHDISDTLVVMVGDGTGGFTLDTAILVGDSPKNIAVGDLNKDGIADIAVACLLDGTVTILLGDGQGGFTSNSILATEGSIAVVIEDFDGDGNNDLAINDARNDNLAVLLGDGTGGFAAPLTFPVGLLPKGLVSGDFDSDGRPDLAVTNIGDDNVTILHNQTPFQASVHVVSVIQKLYSDFYPDPVISPAGKPLRLLVTTTGGEHVNKLSILPWINSSDFLLVGQITTIQFTPTLQDTGTHRIQNIGHGFTGDLIIVEDSAAVYTKLIQMDQQAVSLIHSNAKKQNFPDTIRVFKGIPLTIYNISLDDTHWVSIEPWISAPSPSEQGNVKPRAVTTFEFTPDDTGSFVIEHTVHGFSGTMIVEDPFATAVEDVRSLPKQYALYQNYPNPFNPETRIEYFLKKGGLVQITIYNQLGQFVRRLVNEQKPAGEHTVLWDGRNNEGVELGTGVYLYQLKTDKFVQTRKLILLK